MYRIKYSYFRIDKNFNHVGAPIYGSVSGTTIEAVMFRFNSVRLNHDLAKFTRVNFDFIEEI